MSQTSDLANADFYCDLLGLLFCRHGQAEHKNTEARQFGQTQRRHLETGAPLSCSVFQSSFVWHFIHRVLKMVQYAREHVKHVFIGQREAGRAHTPLSRAAQ